MKRVLFLVLGTLSLLTLGYIYRHDLKTGFGQWRMQRYFASEQLLSRGHTLPIDKTFFILLERDAARCSFVNTQVQRSDFPTPYEIVSASDGKKLTAAERDNRQIFTPQALKRRRPAELGCILSHYKLWKRIAEDPTIHTALILEDDALLCSDFFEKWQSFSKCLPKDFDLIYLYHRCNWEQMGAHRYLVPTSICGLYHSLYLRCTYAYVITKKGAQKLLTRIFPITRSIDNALETAHKKQFDSLTLLTSYFNPPPQDKLQIYSLMPDFAFVEMMKSNIAGQ